MRARQPDSSGYAVNKGVRLYYEVAGDRPETDYGIDSLVGDAIAVLDDLGVERCGLVTVSSGAHRAHARPRRTTSEIAGAG